MTARVLATALWTFATLFGPGITNAFATCSSSSRAAAIQDSFITQTRKADPTVDITLHRESALAKRIPYFARSLALQTRDIRRVAEDVNIIVRQRDGGDLIHLGIAEVEFTATEPANRFAARVAKRGIQYFSGTKVLTRFVAHRKGLNILVVFSETFLDNRIRELLATIPAVIGECNQPR